MRYYMYMYICITLEEENEVYMYIHVHLYHIIGVRLYHATKLLRQLNFYITTTADKHKYVLEYQIWYVY